MSTLSLCTLPVELIHRLFEYLDVPTVLFSFRFVCKRFQSIVDSYDRYKLDMRLISKADFDRLCYIMDPTKISSMILANDVTSPYQIRTFLSQLSINRFIQLRSLRLVRIEETNLFTVLMNITKSPLQSLSINCAAWDTFSYTLRILLSSTIAKSNLERLDLNIAYRDLDLISLSPLPITLKSLRLESCSFPEYCMILQHAVHLQSLTLTNCLMYSFSDTMAQPSNTTCTSTLTSLTIGPGFMRMTELLILLSRTSRLSYLKLILWTDSLDSVIDGKKWEDFISEHLALLERFEFFFDDSTQIDYQTLNIQTYVRSFQTPFWLEQHRWYIAFDYIKRFSAIRLYSLPICNGFFSYYTPSNQISYSTLPPEGSLMELTQYVHDINLNLNEIIESDEDTSATISTNSPTLQNNPVFRNISRLSLALDDRQPYTPFRLLQSIIDLSSLTRLSLQIPAHSFVRNSTLTDYLAAILKETSNIHSLKVTHLPNEGCHIDADVFCTIVPLSVRHLQISIGTFDHAKTIVTQLKRLFSVTFYSTTITDHFEDIQKWIDLRRDNSVYRQSKKYIQIWLGKSIEHDDLRSSMKRIFHRIRRMYSN